MAKDYREALRLPENHSALIILGMGPQALFLLRTYRKHYKHVYLVGEKNWIGYLSRYGNKTCTKSHNLKDQIILLLNKHGHETPILVSGGETLRQYLDQKWMHRLNVLPGPMDALKILNDKSRLYDFIYNNESEANLLPSYDFDHEWHGKFPVILKWKTDIQKKPFKVLVLYNHQEYIEAYKKYRNYSDDIILQPYLQNKSSIAFAGYCIKGSINTYVVVRQVRQYPPGLTNLVKPYHGEHREKITEFCQKMLGKLNYTGFVEFEFIKDNNTDLLYLLECNPRPWGWIDYLKFIHLNPNCTIVNIVRDICHLFSEHKSLIKQLSLRRVIKYASYYKAIWDIKDPLPILGQLLNSRKGE